MRTIEVKELAYLPLGRQGENKAQRIVWPGIADSWARLYGEGVFALTVLREGDSAPYPASLKSENGDVIWTLSNADTARAGEGMAELTYTVGGDRQEPDVAHGGRAVAERKRHDRAAGGLSELGGRGAFGGGGRGKRRIQDAIRRQHDGELVQVGRGVGSLCRYRRSCNWPAGRAGTQG